MWNNGLSWPYRERIGHRDILVFGQYDPYIRFIASTWTMHSAACQYGAMYSFCFTKPDIYLRSSCRIFLILWIPPLRCVVTQETTICFLLKHYYYNRRFLVYILGLYDLKTENILLGNNLTSLRKAKQILKQQKLDWDV